MATDMGTYGPGTDDVTEYAVMRGDELLYMTLSSYRVNAMRDLRILRATAAPAVEKSYRLVSRRVSITRYKWVPMNEGGD